MVGGVVAGCGPVGFVGMMAPHICRLLVGSNHRVLLPASMFFGGAFLVLCDTAARIVIFPAELPVGVITAFLAHHSSCGSSFARWDPHRLGSRGGIYAAPALSSRPRACWARAEGSVERAESASVFPWIPPLTRDARSVGMTQRARSKSGMYPPLQHAKTRPFANRTGGENRIV